MNKNIKASAQGGFTLIELIVVITILGILAATALPKFVSLGADARKASVQAAKGALAATSGMVHGKFLIDPSLTKVQVEDVSVDITSGYPSSASVAEAAGLTTDDYNVDAGVGNVSISPKSAGKKDKCKVTYSNAVAGTDGTVAAPKIEVDTSDCS